MIQGYPHHTSVAAGGSLVLHVSTDAPYLRARFYRWGDGFAPVQVSSWREGELAAPGSAACDWHWPVHDFAIPDDWPSAVYMAQLQEWGTAARAAIQRRGGAVCRARRRSQSPVLQDSARDVSRL